MNSKKKRIIFFPAYFFLNVNCEKVFVFKKLKPHIVYNGSKLLHGTWKTQ